VIVNTASLAGLLGPRYMAAYAASKHAVIGMTKSAAKDLAPHGVRVCAVAPGILEGRMWLTQVEGRARCALLAKTGSMHQGGSGRGHSVLPLPLSCR
jgi:NAD(P)-dependent dehydrogenase (short-subunit alcohol dehydrogenase family)